LTKKVWLVPVLVVALTVSALLGARLISIPTLAFTYDDTFKGHTSRSTFIVQGVRCYGTANFLREHIAPVPGLVSFVAYAGRHRVDIRFRPDMTTPQDIISAIERPVMTREGPRSFYKVLDCKT
jgi:hypothetical protein